MIERGIRVSVGCGIWWAGTGVPWGRSAGGDCSTAPPRRTPAPPAPISYKSCLLLDSEGYGSRGDLSRTSGQRKTRRSPTR